MTDLEFNQFEDRKKVFRQTLSIILDNGGDYICEDGSRAFVEREGLLQDSTVMYDRPFSVADVPCLPSGEHTSVEVVRGDCLEVAYDYTRLGFRRVAVLNCASYRNPGGGVLNGCRAQEEDLFRRTNLFRSLYQYAPYAGQYGLNAKYPQYPLDKHFGGVYSPDVTVFRTRDYRLMPHPFCIDVISAASVNRPRLTCDGRHFADREDISTVKDTIRTIFRIGLANGIDCLILCPIGCGAFANPPEDVAMFFKEIMEEPEFRDKYRKIVFSILEDHNSMRRGRPSGNYAPFADVFGEAGPKKKIATSSVGFLLDNIYSDICFSVRSEDSIPKMFHVEMDDWDIAFTIDECAEVNVCRRGSDESIRTAIKDNVSEWLRRPCRLQPKITYDEYVRLMWASLHDYD